MSTWNVSRETQLQKSVVAALPLLSVLPIIVVACFYVVIVVVVDVVVVFVVAVCVRMCIVLYVCACVFVSMFLILCVCLSKACLYWKREVKILYLPKNSQINLRLLFLIIMREK